MANNLRFSKEIVYRLRKKLRQLCADDTQRMIATLDVVCDRDRVWGSGCYHYLWEFKSAIRTPNWWLPTEEETIMVASQLREELLRETTEQTANRKQKTTENSPIQLTLDFSETTEKTLRSPSATPAATSVSVSKTRKQKDIEQLCQKFNGKGNKKGWLSPQYKYFDECGRSHTITDPSLSPTTKIYGPYWTYRWSRPGKQNDGNLYLGLTNSKKFQRFSVVWDQCDSAAEILKLLNQNFG